MNTEDIIKSGWLRKEGGSVKTWKRRWFVLLPTALVYFKCKEDVVKNCVQPLGSVHLEEITAVETSCERPSKTHVFCLRGSRDGRIFFFCADTADICKSWIAAIKPHLSSHRKASIACEIRVTYIQVDVFIGNGIRIPSSVHLKLLRDISRSCLTDKRLDTERGWYCDRVITVQEVLNIFSSSYGWLAEYMYESQATDPDNPQQLKPVITILLLKALMHPRNSVRHRIIRRFTGRTYFDSTTESSGMPRIDGENNTFQCHGDGRDEKNMIGSSRQSNESLIRSEGLSDLDKSRRSTFMLESMTLDEATERHRLIQPNDGFWTECGQENGTTGPSTLSSIHMLLEDAEEDMSWYRQFFFGRLHSTFMAVESEEGPIVLSVIREVEKGTYGGDNTLGIREHYQYRAIVWKPSGDERLCVALSGPKETLSPRELADLVCPELLTKSTKLVQVDTTADVEEALLALENQRTNKRIRKFGLLFMRDDQFKEDDMYSNETGSRSFHDFCEILGDVIELKGWSKYRAGLDTKKNNTGTHSLYTVFRGYEIMFHVSTMLPYNAVDRQQLERKKHIGNDIVVIIFREPGCSKPFSPKSISSHFLHIFVVVEPVIMTGSHKLQYRVEVSGNANVAPFGPELPNPAIFSDKKLLRHFLVTKCLNGEASTYNAPAFQVRSMRTLGGMIDQIVSRYCGGSKSASTFNPLKKMAALAQALRPISNTISLSAKTSMINSASESASSDLYSTEEIVTGFPHLINCMGKLEMTLNNKNENVHIIGTSNGLYLRKVNRGSDMWPVKTLKIHTVTRLVVRQDIGIVVTLESKRGGHSYIISYKIQEVLDSTNSLNCVTLATAHKIIDSKNSTAFDMVAQDSQTLSNDLLIVAKNKMTLYQYDTISCEFIKMRSYSLSDSCHYIRICGSTAICVEPSAFEIINLVDGLSRIVPLPTTAGAINTVDAVTFLEATGDILLTYNNISMFIDSQGYESRETLLKWMSTPYGVEATLFSQVVGFTASSVEVRSIFNGSTLMVLPVKTSVVLYHNHLLRTIYTAHNVLQVTNDDSTSSESSSIYSFTYKE